MRKSYTLKELLAEIKSEKTGFEVGHFYEVKKSYYPNSRIKKDVKNIIVEGKEVTLPLACSSKSKRGFSKDGMLFETFFKNITRGDFLKIIETDGIKATCVNKSLKEDIFGEYYNEELKHIIISHEDILSGCVKRVYRGINKYIL